MARGDIRLLDARWLLFRALCRWQLGETQPRWVAVAFMGAIEFGWITLVQLVVGGRLAWSESEMPPMWWFLVIYAGFFAVNWWLIVPAKGAAEFEQRFRRWPSWARALALPFAVTVVVSMVALYALKVWTWF